MPSGNSSLFTITLRTRFDETTISAGRPKDLPLAPNPRSVQVIDARGQAYPVLAVIGVPLSMPLKPGESYLSELQFMLPSGVGSPRLLLSSNGWPERLLIGDEQSPLHGKTWFVLEDSLGSRASKKHL